MKVIKICIHISILLITTIIGFAYGDIYGKRARSIRDLIYCFRLLENEILIGNSDLPRALENVYKKGSGQIVELFKNIRDDLIQEEREDIFESFISLKDKFRDKYALENQDIEIILHLGKTIGKSDRDEQEKNFKFIIKEMETLYYEANRNRQVYEKLYRSLGLLLGIGIVIIII